MMKLWGRPTSTCTQRVLWTLAEAEVPYELTLASATMGENGHVWLGHTPYGGVDTLAYLAMNPNGSIPTIDDGGFILWESNAIVAYIARRYAPKKLFGGSEQIFAHTLKWMMWVNYSLEPAMSALINHLERLPAGKRSVQVVEEWRQVMVEKMTLLEGQFARSPYLAGEAFSIADIPPAIAIQRFEHCRLDRPRLPRLENWLARLGEREAFRRHIAPRDKHFS
ncbi:MAG: glutathione S-transferase family protein [Betaproteobacteria bacterium]|nr:glutathione S-transferase family protein [Betaproteobacteria bacterium]